MIALLAVAAAVLLIPVPVPVPGGARGPSLPRLGQLSRQREQFRDDAIAFVLALAGELHAGSDPNRAVQICGRRFPVASRAARAARVGGDVAAALRADAASADAALLRSAAGAWDLAGRTGSGLADVLDQLADGYRRTVEVRRTLAVELASPRATARLMSLLPVMGLVLAMLLGADPLRWLTTTAPGLACLVAGIALNLLGYLWIRQIVRGLSESW